MPKPELPSAKEPHRGFGYVEFEIPADAKEAIDLAKHAVSEEDRIAAGRGFQGLEDVPEDPMQGLEGLDVAGPRPA